MGDVVVSVCCITYNHADYINDCLDGFLSQKTDFPLEFIIHDDASTDNTQEIIKNRVGKDARFTLLFREENIKSKGKAVFPLIYKMAKGRYMATCEGDDYWTDPFKLQRQVDYLEAHPQCMLVAHDAEVVHEGIPVVREIFYTKPFQGGGDFRFHFADEFNDHFLATASLVFPRGYWLEELVQYLERCFVGDIPLCLYLLSKGYGYYINEKLGVKRRNPGGITQSTERRKVQFKRMYETWKVVDLFTPAPLKPCMQVRLSNFERALAKSYVKQGRFKGVQYLFTSFLRNPAAFLSDRHKKERCMSGANGSHPRLAKGSPNRVGR